jgi:hypothetical protein
MKIGFFSILTLILITLKLLGKITWSWFWVFGVITIPVCIFLICIIVALLVMFAEEFLIKK